VLATAVFLAVDAESLLRLRSPWFWILAGASLLGSVAGQMRSIALSTCVTLLVPEDRRDRANGMVGTVTGLSFAITSVFSGLVIGTLGMGWALYVSVVLTAGSLVHLRTIHITEPEPQPAAAGEAVNRVDIRGALDAIAAVDGLLLLVFLGAFNNLLGGVFIALIDAYGLSLVAVETWGFLWGFISLAMIVGGVFVARKGLGRSPLRLILAANLVNWIVCSVFAIQSSIVLLTIGMVVWLGLMPVIEAAEQTVLQRSIPFERQGRVFGFAQLVENAAAPLTAFLMAPLAETVFMPLMTDGRGADLIGGWFGTGPERGLALMFTLAGLIGVVVTIAVWGSRSYKRLAVAY
jgi:DHA3 family multidrug efflux protein-like MFS transporter